MLCCPFPLQPAQPPAIAIYPQLAAQLRGTGARIRLPWAESVPALGTAASVLSHGSLFCSLGRGIDQMEMGG